MEDDDRRRIVRKPILQKFGDCSDQLLGRSEKGVTMMGPVVHIDVVRRPWMKDDEEADRRKFEADYDQYSPDPSIPERKVYVPPHMRHNSSDNTDRRVCHHKFREQRNHLTRLRISNLPESTTEEDVRDLVGWFGPVVHIALPKDRRDRRQCAGYAFVEFQTREDAKAALEQLNGHRYDYLILKAEWAKQ